MLREQFFPCVFFLSLPLCSEMQSLGKKQRAPKWTPFVCYMMMSGSDFRASLSVIKVIILRRVLFEVFDKHSSKLVCSSIERFLVFPSVPWVEQVRFDTGQRLGNAEAEPTGFVKLDIVDTAIENRVDTCASCLDAHTATDAVTTANPTGVDQVGVDIVTFHLLTEQLCVGCWMQGQESLTKAGRESRLRLSNSALGTRYLRCIAREEVV